MPKQGEKFGSSIHKRAAAVENIFSTAAFLTGKAKQEMIGASSTEPSMDA